MNGAGPHGFQQRGVQRAESGGSHLHKERREGEHVGEGRKKSTSGEIPGVRRERVGGRERNR